VTDIEKTDLTPHSLLLEHNVIDVLDTTTMPEFARLPASTVMALQDAVDEEMRVAKNHVAMLAVALNYRYAEKDREYRSQSLKPTGRIRFPDQEAIVIADQAKQVHWDRAKLSAALNEMEPELAEKYGKWTLTVEERFFAEAPNKIRTLLEPARTVAVGKPSYRLELPESATNKGKAA
jgi:hypothetical protein